VTSTEPRAPQYDPDIEYVGFAVSAADGRAGRVDRDTDEVSPWQLVVRLGPRGHWRRVLVPSTVVVLVDRPGRRVGVALTRAELRNLPRFDLATYEDPPR
jgi:hypothetical protein